MSAFMTTTVRTDDAGWWADCCSSAHITNDVNDLIEFQPWREPIRTGGGIVYSTHRGTVTHMELSLRECL